MYRKYLFVIFISIFMLLTGCIDVTTKVIVKNDGSGIIEETVLMSNKVIEMIKSFGEGFESEGDEFALYDEEEVKQEAKDFGEGVTFISGEEVEVDGKKGYKAIYKFKDINLLTMSSDPSDKMPDENYSGDENAEEDLIKFNFISGSTPRLEILMPVDPEEMQAEFDNDETVNDSTLIDPMFEQFKDILAEMKINILLEVDGDISQTNATYRDGNQITLMYMSFKELFANSEKYKEFVKAKPDSYEETMELLQNIPGFKFELNQKVFVEFD